MSAAATHVRIEHLLERNLGRVGQPHPLIPAQAGIQNRLWSVMSLFLGPRFRGDERIVLPAYMLETAPKFVWGACLFASYR